MSRPPINRSSTPTTARQRPAGPRNSAAVQTLTKTASSTGNTIVTTISSQGVNRLSRSICRLSSERSALDLLSMIEVPLSSAAPPSHAERSCRPRTNALHHGAGLDRCPARSCPCFDSGHGVPELLAHPLPDSAAFAAQPRQPASVLDERLMPCLRQYACLPNHRAFGTRNGL